MYNSMSQFTQLHKQVVRSDMPSVMGSGKRCPTPETWQLRPQPGTEVKLMTRPRFSTSSICHRIIAYLPAQNNNNDNSNKVLLDRTIKTTHKIRQDLTLLSTQYLHSKSHALGNLVETSCNFFASIGNSTVHLQCMPTVKPHSPSKI